MLHPPTLRSLDMEVVRRRLSQFMPISDEQWEAILPLLSIELFAKGALVHRAGDICTDSYFIVEGLIRLFYVKDGNESTRQFFFENGIVSDLVSCATRQPSRLNLDAIEPAKLCRIPFSLMNMVPGMRALAFEGALIGMSNRIDSIYMDSPEEKYLQLVRERPKVMQRVPQYMIASYVGVTPEGLSRIKKRIADRERS